MESYAPRLFRAWHDEGSHDPWDDRKGGPHRILALRRVGIVNGVLAWALKNTVVNGIYGRLQSARSAHVVRRNTTVHPLDASPLSDPSLVYRATPFKAQPHRV